MTTIDGVIADVERVLVDSPNNTVVELSDLGEFNYRTLRGALEDKGYSVLGIINLVRNEKAIGEKTYTLHISRRES